MNSVEISGRLTRDPEVRMIGQQKNWPVASLNVAVDDGFSRWDRESQKRWVGSGFYRVEVAGPYGEATAGKLTKGDEVWVRGSLSQYTIGEDEKKDTKTQIRAAVVIKIGSSGGSTGQTPVDPLEQAAMEEPF